MSPLAQGRGLKRLQGKGKVLEKQVAPRAGAWIETTQPLMYWAWQQGVAPRAGAWIETIEHYLYPCDTNSRPSRRGVD